MTFVFALFDILVFGFIIISIIYIVDNIFITFHKKSILQIIPQNGLIISRWISKLLIPVAILSVILSIVKICVTGNDNLILIILSSFLLLIVFINILKYIYIFKENPIGELNDNIEYKSVFEIIGNFFNNKTVKDTVYKEIYKKIDVVLGSINYNNIIANSILSNIDKYIEYQKNECKIIFEKRETVNNLLTILADNIKKVSKDFIELIKKINFSNAAIKYYSESENLLDSINSNFISEYTIQSEYLNSGIDTIINRINEISYKCTQFIKLFKIFENIILSYSSRIESALLSKSLSYISENGDVLELNDIICNIISDKKQIESKFFNKHSDKINSFLTIDKEVSESNQKALKAKEAEIKKLNDKIIKLNDDHEKEICNLNLNSKKYKKYGIITIIICTLAFIVTTCLININAKKSNNLNLQNQISAQLAIINELEENNQKLTNKNNKLEELAKNYETECNTLKAEKRSMQQNLNELQSKNSKLESDKNVLEGDLNILERKFDVVSISIGNKNQYSEWLQQPGYRLNASSMRLLTPQITVNSLINDYIRFYINIIDPKGNKMQNTSTSSHGYTYYSDNWLSKGKNYKIVLAYFGYTDKSVYTISGVYTIEIYYNNRIVASEKVTLY